MDRPSSPTQTPWDIIPYIGRSEFKRQRIRNLSLIRTIIAHLRNFDYIVVLGPHFCEKSRLLEDVQLALTEKSTFQSIYVNLWQARSDDEQTFFTSLDQLIRRGDVHGNTTETIDNSQTSVTTTSAFKSFLHHWPVNRQSHLVLLIDHLHALPHDLTNLLLTTLRGVRTEWPLTASYRLMVVVTGGIDLVSLSHGATSPFNIAKRILVEPLDRQQSQSLAEQTLQAYGIDYTANSIETILTYAGGDHYLIPRLCQLCHDLAAGFQRPTVTKTVVQQAVERLDHRDELRLPIREAIQLIEEDPDTLLDIIIIQRTGKLAQNQTRQNIARNSVNRLQLCGAVVLEGRDYYIKNELYQRGLSRYFTPTRVAQVLRMSGRWQEAIDYLTDLPSIALSMQVRSDLLEAIVQSIFATDHLDDAFAMLVKGLEYGFQLKDIYIYRADVSQSELCLVYPPPQTVERASVIPLSEMERVEVQTFVSGEYTLRTQEDDLRLVSALKPEKRSIGVVSIEHFCPRLERTGLPPQLPELQRFLRYAAGAIEDVILRTAFREIGRAVLDVGAVDQNLQRVLEIVANAVGGDIAAFYLFAPIAGVLVRTTIVGIDWQTNDREPITVSVSSQHPAAICFYRALINVNTPSERNQPEVDRVGSSNFVRVFLPLRAAGNYLGVLKVGFAKVRWEHFNQEDITTLYTFADQVAIAVYNMQLLQRTDETLTRRVRELEKLQDISRTITGTLNLLQVLRQIIQHVKSLFSETEVTVWEYNPLSQSFTMLESSLHDKAYRQTTLDRNTVAGLAIQQNMVQVVEDTQERVTSVTWRVMQAHDLQKLIVVPLISKDKPLGAISLYAKSVLPFEQSQRALLMAIGAQAATAIENARQFAALQEAEHQVRQSRDQDLRSMSQVLLHRLGNNMGDIPHQIRRIRGLLDERTVNDLLAHIEQRLGNVMELLPSFRTVVHLAEVKEFYQLNLLEVLQHSVTRLALADNAKPIIDAPSEPLWVQGDLTFLSDAFQSVIENGYEAMAGKGVAQIEVKPNEKYVFIRIRDTGSGIDPAQQSKIFDLGFSTKPATTHGRGRGLFTCRAILRKHGGEIALEHMGSGGTTFEIVLPLAED